ncbi:hypothetical protein KUCAC02_017301, partial [Chaenocephalus aceratus]
MTMRCTRPPLTVQIHAAQRVYPTHTDVTLLAVSEAADPAQLLWIFGDSTSERTASRNVTKRYRTPGRYDVFVVLWSGRSSVSSDCVPLEVQSAVRLNRLLHPASVLQNQALRLSCRVTAGTDVSFPLELWRRILPAGTRYRAARLPQDRRVQGGVKNMGPRKLQVRRHEVIRLGVTYETEVDCDISRGLHYTWSLLDSAGRVFSLPLVNT